MRLTDRYRATVLHATARWTVHYDRGLRIAGTELPRPVRLDVPTRHGPVGVRVYRDPAWPAGPRGTYVHFHGGAWLMRHPEMDDFWCRYVVAMAGVVVVNVDFHTGPYVTYPVAQEECHDVVAWLHDHGSDPDVVERLGTPLAPGRIAVGGFSPRVQVLGVPALDLASDVPSGAGMISPSLRNLVRRVYFPDADRRREAYASPLLADDLSGLPPAVVLTGERDTLRPDGEAYARRLTDAGVEVTYDCTPGVDHYFLTEDPRRARTTMAVVAAALEARLAP